MVWLLPSGLTPLTQSAGAGCLSVVSLATSWTTPALLHDVTKVAKEMKPRHSRVFHASGSWLIMSRWPPGQQSYGHLWGQQGDSTRVWYRAECLQEQSAPISQLQTCPEAFLTGTQRPHWWVCLSTSTRM